MSAVVMTTRMRPSLGDAVSSLLAGDFEDALDRCDALDRQGEGAPEVASLRARALLRLDRCSEALEVLGFTGAEGPTSDADPMRRMLIGVALTRSGDAERGLEHLRRIRPVVECSHASIRSEVALSIGLAHYALRHLDSAEAALDEVNVEDDVVYARSLEYKGWIACARGSHHEGAAMFVAALTKLEHCKAYDRFLEANCLQALAHLAVDGLDRQAWQAVSVRRARVRWDAKGLGHLLFRLSMSTATFQNDVEGQPMEAAVEARRAYEIAPTPAYRIQALCKRASIARSAGERIAQNDHVQAAVDAFRTLNVSALSADERIVSLTIAEELANAGRPSEARSHLDAYCRDRPAIGTLAIGGDPRRETYEQLVAGQVAEAEAARSEATSLYRRVLKKSMKSSLRHGVIAAIRLADVAGDTSYLRGYAALAAREVRESSWIHESLKRMSSMDTLGSLTAPQSECLTMMSRGYTNSQIAHARGRSVNTVRNQVSTLFELFGVRNRAQLIGAYLHSSRTNSSRGASFAGSGGVTGRRRFSD